MDANEREFLERCAHAAIGAAFEVSNVLGVGFLEKVYENALAVELRERGFYVEQQVALDVQYKNVTVGHYVPDLLIEKCLIVELKCADHLCNEHLAQCLNYLKATSLPLALLFNFKPTKVEFKRIVHNY